MDRRVSKLPISTQQAIVRCFANGLPSKFPMGVQAVTARDYYQRIREALLEARKNSRVRISLGKDYEPHENDRFFIYSEFQGFGKCGTSIHVYFRDQVEIVPPDYEGRDYPKNAGWAIRITRPKSEEDEIGVRDLSLKEINPYHSKSEVDDFWAEVEELRRYRGFPYKNLDYYMAEVEFRYSIPDEIEREIKVLDLLGIPYPE